jgi:hypothetical protein
MSGAVTVVAAGSSSMVPNAVDGLMVNAPGRAPLFIPGDLRPSH